MANRRASITDLAKTLGLSPSTISRALSDHADVSEATKARVRQLAEELHYQPNQLAAALRRISWANNNFCTYGTKNIAFFFRLFVGNNTN